MNIDSATMTIPYDEARAAYTHYRQAIKENRATKDDVVIARAYHALMRGRKVIDLIAAIGAQGCWPEGHRWYGSPKLAVARASWLRVNARLESNRIVFEIGWARANLAGRVEVPRESISNWRWEMRQQPTRAALVPTIPPQFRPKDPIENYHILFEADWSNAPVDPMLLKHIAGPFYVVLAAWDLMPIEQAVLRQQL